MGRHQTPLWLGPLTIADTLFSSNLPPDYGVEDQPVALSLGDAQAVSVTYSPSAPGERAGSLVLVKDSAPSTYSIPLTSLTILPPRHQEQYCQVTPSIDVLFLMDSGGSMQPDNEAAAEAMRSLLGTLLEQRVSYQVGLMTYSLADGGRLQGILGDERGLEALTLGLLDELLAGHSAGLLRPGRALALLTATDEEDGSLKQVDL